MTALREEYSTDIQGMDRATGTVSLASALKPERIDIDSSKVALRANFVVAGGPVDEEEEEREVAPVPPDEEELVPPTEVPHRGPRGHRDRRRLQRQRQHPRRPPPVRIKGLHSDTSLEKAFLRVQIGGAGCGDDAPEPRVHQIELRLVEGRVTSDKGQFQSAWLSGPQRFQLDLDDAADSGNESHLIEVEETCAAPASALEIELLWNIENVDVDLHVWNAEAE